MKIAKIITLLVVVIFSIAFIVMQISSNNNKKEELQEIGSTISFNLPLYIIENRFPVTNLDDNSEIKYALSCYKDRTKQDNELLLSDVKLVVTKIGHVQNCAPHGEGCWVENFYIAKSQSGKLVQVTPNDIRYNFNNCKERSPDYK